jgi:hypothetical protein
MMHEKWLLQVSETTFLGLAKSGWGDGGLKVRRK